jgi:putative transposase
MKAQTVTDTLDLAVAKSGLEKVNVGHRPRLLSDNGATYISGDLAKWLDDKNIEHIRGAPYHPQTQGKIERWRQTLKNLIMLNNYYLLRELEEQISVFGENYNNNGLLESLNNLTPADVYFGRGQAILEERKRIRKSAIQNRRLQHQQKAA